MEREALTPATCVLAREMVGWTPASLALRSGVTIDTVGNFEAGRRQARYETVTALLRAFRGAGVTFVMRGGEARCVWGPSAVAPDALDGMRGPSGRTP